MAQPKMRNTSILGQFARALKKNLAEKGIDVSDPNRFTVRELKVLRRILKQMRTPLHYGGFAGKLYCNGSTGGQTTKRAYDVTCKGCIRYIESMKAKGYVAVSGDFKKDLRRK